jgi:hypothetical protein
MEGMLSLVVQMVGNYCCVREENLKKDINKQIHKLLKDEIYEKVKNDIINVFLTLFSRIN